MKIIILLYFFYLIILSTPIRAYPYLQTTYSDVDGDNDPEQITIKFLEHPNRSREDEPWEFVLQIGQASIKSYLNAEVNGFYIIDIDKSDHFKEVVVHSSGPYPESSEVIFRFDGKTVKEMGKLPGDIEKADNGFLYVSCFNDFWDRIEKYALDKQTLKLKHIPQQYYYVGVKAIVDRSFAVYISPLNKRELVRVDIGEDIEILACDISDENPYDEWYMIVTPNRLLGWAQYQMIEGRFHFPELDGGCLVEANEIDLDGDDKIESIRMITLDEDGNYILQVDNTSISCSDYLGMSNFYVVDLDKDDDHFEIVVRSPSNDYTYYLYHDGALTKLGELKGKITYTGAGAIQVVESKLFWDKHDIYIFDNESQKIQWVPTDIYDIGIQVRIIEPFMIYQSPFNTNNLISTLDKGTSIEIQSCKPKVEEKDGTKRFADFWYSIKTQSGLVGWADEKSVRGKIQWRPDIKFISHRDEKYELSEEADLNGDNILEFIKLSTNDNMDTRLSIGDSTIETIADEVLYLHIIDIDKGDNYKEVDVHTPGPSDDDIHDIYWFDGQNINRVGSLIRWPDFPGNGVVYVDDWMGFWARTDKYVLNPQTHVLECILQELYYVNYEIFVKESFPIVKSPTDKTVIANLKPGSRAKILACDFPTERKDVFYDYEERWYLIKSESGICGWAQEKTIRFKASLHYAD